ncbi:MAG TPA: hypothetical protein IAA58_02110 [Candidatus Gallacutalibacter stercoravium]|nr:hypothetical protein [Candidatus Gallacutalibacter stercoravium]
MKNPIKKIKALKKKTRVLLCCALALAIGAGATWALWPAPQQAPAVKPSSQDDYPELPFPPNIHYRTPDLAMVVNDATLIVDATVDEVKPVENRVFVPEEGTGEKAIYDKQGISSSTYQVQPIYLTVNEKLMGTDDSKRILMYIRHIQIGCMPNFQPGDRFIFVLREYEDGYRTIAIHEGIYYVAADDKVYPARVSEKTRSHSGQSLSSFKSEIHSLAQQKLTAMIQEGLQGGSEASSTQ